MRFELERKHIEFLQSDLVGWSDSIIWPGTKVKYLSQAKKGSGATLLQLIPKNWECRLNFWNKSAEEFFVIEGQISIGLQTFSKGCYGELYRKFSKVSADSTTLVIRFLGNKELSITHQYSTALKKIDTNEMSWKTGDVNSELSYLASSLKTLRSDAMTGESTFLLKTDSAKFPPNMKGRQEKKSAVEECFLLEGDLIGHLGTMRSGAYYWRPPFIPHGPYGSKNGSLSIIRFVGGQEDHLWGGEEVEFEMNPIYQPVL